MNFTDRGGGRIFILAGGETGKLTERALVNSGQLVMSRMDDSAAELICSTFSPVSLGPCGLWAGGLLVLAVSVGAEWPPVAPPLPWALPGQSLSSRYLCLVWITCIDPSVTF